MANLYETSLSPQELENKRQKCLKQAKLIAENQKFDDGPVCPVFALIHTYFMELPHQLTVNGHCIEEIW